MSPRGAAGGLAKEAVREHGAARRQSRQHFPTWQAIQHAEGEILDAAVKSLLGYVWCAAAGSLQEALARQRQHKHANVGSSSRVKKEVAETPRPLQDELLLGEVVASQAEA